MGDGDGTRRMKKDEELLWVRSSFCIRFSWSLVGEGARVWLVVLMCVQVSSDGRGSNSGLLLLLLFPNGRVFVQCVYSRL